MPYLNENTLATKARGVREHQDVLFKMRENPGQIDRVEIDRAGRVKVAWKNGTTSDIGVLHTQYWKDFARMFVRAFEVTGGKPMPQYQRRYEDGTSTPLMHFGCILIIGLL